MDREQKKALLTEHIAFEHLSEVEIQRLAESAYVRSYDPDETIFLKGDPTTDLMAVVSGCVQIRTVSENGKQLVLNTMHPGEMLGEIGVLDGGARTADAVAVEATELMTITRKSFLDVVVGNPEFCKSLIAILCGRIRATTEQAEDLALLDLRKRLAKKLISLADHGKDPDGTTPELVIRLSQQDLGEMMGTTREAINKHLGIWAKDGLITLRRNEIVILDEAGLKEIVGP